MLDIGLIHCKEYEFDAGRRKDESLSKKPALANSKEAVICVEAPGSIHFLGGHCNPSAGLFLSAAIDRCIYAAVSPRKDNSLRFYAADIGERKRATVVNLKYKREDRWANYIKTALFIFKEMEFPVKGMNFTFSGNIPQHIGLASSSAIEVAAAVALRDFFHAKIPDLELARRLAQSHLMVFGRNSCLADYITSLCAKKNQFLVIDEAGLSVDRIKSPFLRCKFILIDSRVPRFGIEGELAARREELKSALEILSNERTGSNFRDFAEADIMESMGNLPEEIRRRSLHIVQEIRRVLDAKDCLEHTDLPGFSRSIFHSHESLRDLFELSCPEVDWIVKRAQETEGTYGSRMTGQGFGGCTYAIVKNEAAGEYRKKIEEYEKIFGFHPAIYEVKLAAGSRVISGKKR
ncbi:MAG: galactokinase [Treponema sp.]|nr:galactokinase [Treponema sp.]